MAVETKQSRFRYARITRRSPLAYFLVYLVGAIALLWCILGPFMFFIGFYTLLIKGDHVTWNGISTQNTGAKVGFLAMAVMFFTLGFLYLKFVFPRLTGKKDSREEKSHK